jgi:hypothetical protein
LYQESDDYPSRTTLFVRRFRQDVAMTNVIEPAAHNSAAINVPAPAGAADVRGWITHPSGEKFREFA